MSGTACKTISYAIAHAISSVCLHGTLYNMSENMQLVSSANPQNEINIYCNDCLLGDSEISLSCETGTVISFLDFTMKGNIITLGNVHVNMYNAILEDTLIHNLPNLDESAYNELHFENSTLSCIETTNCGLLFTNISATKVVFINSHLNNFRLDFSTSQLMVAFYETLITLPRIRIKVTSLEYLRVPAIIQFDKVSAVKHLPIASQSIIPKNGIPLRIQRSSESKQSDYFIILDLSNPYVIINECHFIGIHLDIQSKTHKFEPVLFYLFLERSSFMNTYNIGNGGSLTITSEVRHSEVKILDCKFSNNSAIKGPGNVQGQGGALYVNANSLKLMLEDCNFKTNIASDSGLALYSTQGVEVSVTNCTFQHNLELHASIQKSILFVSGEVINFQGLFQVFNPNPDSIVGPIDVLYLGQGRNLDIKTYCPKWYNNILEYTSVSDYSEAIPDAHYLCSPCSDNYYTSGVENDLLYYNNKDNMSLVEQLNRNEQTGICRECPYGALCTGNNVLPRPNDWGYWHEDELVFQQCPAGYCCSGSDSSTCNVYDYCPGNRTGTLCGACHEGFSIAILTGACTPDSLCGREQWFWVVVLLATMAYALWYIFKDVFFLMLYRSVTLLKIIFNRSSSKMKKNLVRIDIKPAAKEQMVSSFDIDNISSNKGSYVDANKTSEKINREEDIDKGYFGIVTYYVQMAAIIKIEIEFSDIDKSESFLDRFVDNIGMFLSLELTQMSFDVCPVVGLTTVGKHLYNVVFLVGIYMSWSGLFAVTIIVQKLLKRHLRTGPVVRNAESFRLMLIRGIVEIIKYTYAGFCSIIFMSLVCTQIGNKYVWWHDGTNVCLENWQIVIIIFALIYAIAFPLTLALGLKLLKENKISWLSFVGCSICPLMTVFFIVKYICKGHGSKLPPKSTMSEESKAVISVLQGPYRGDDMQVTIYWESVVSIRRLLITGMTLVGYASIRMTIITALCLIFLVQHIYKSPFQVRSSNDVEALSLSLLVLTSVINLLKASLTDSGVVPSGPTTPFFKGLELCEKMFVLIIIAYILFVEVKFRKEKKGKIFKAK